MITLTGISKKGKERVKRDGSTGWELLKLVSGPVSFSKSLGPWLLIQQPGNDNSMRWVHYVNDKNFKVELEAA